MAYAHKAQRGFLLALKWYVQLLNLSVVVFFFSFFHPTDKAQEMRSLCLIQRSAHRTSPDFYCKATEALSVNLSKVICPIGRLNTHWHGIVWSSNQVTRSMWINCLLSILKVSLLCDRHWSGTSLKYLLTNKTARRQEVFPSFAVHVAIKQP